jgi:predicted nucleic acid-binding protein
MAIVFLDASVLFKAAVTRFLLGAERVGEFRVAWSPAVVDEARRNLVALGREAALVAFEENLVWPREVELVQADVGVQTSLQRTDAKDRHVLAAAVAAAAEILVTSNARDFDVTEAAALGVRIATPDEFLAEVAERNPHALVRYIERVPPDRFERYVRRLESELPTAMAVLAPLFDE